jgi:hypothetical protein
MDLGRIVPVEVVIADANVLLAGTTRDFFLDLAKAGVVEVRWSPHILEEVREHFFDAHVNASPADLYSF